MPSLHSQLFLSIEDRVSIPGLKEALIQRVFVEYSSLDCCVSQATISQVGCQTVTSTALLYRQKF